MRYFFIAYILVLVLVLSLAGLRGNRSSRSPLEILPDMDQQAKIKAQQPSQFFSDGASARQPVSGTQPLGSEIPDHGEGALPRPASDSYFMTGRFGEYYGHGIPTEAGSVDATLLFQGQEQYEIYCAVCHGASGNGKGVVANYFVGAIADLTDDRLLPGAADSYTDGQLFEVITQGKGLMGSYGAKIAPQDRWAVIAYLRALQKHAGKSLQTAAVKTDEPTSDVADLATPDHD